MRFSVVVDISRYRHPGESLHVLDFGHKCSDIVDSKRYILSHTEETMYIAR